MSEQAENLIIIWRLLCMFFLHQTETTPVFFPLPSSSNLDMFWPLHSPSNHIKYLRCGLFSLDPPHKHLSLLSLVKRPTFPACFILIPSKISQFRLFFFYCSRLPTLVSAAAVAFSIWILIVIHKARGKPISIFPSEECWVSGGAGVDPKIICFAKTKIRAWELMWAFFGFWFISCCFDPCTILQQ